MQFVGNHFVAVFAVYMLCVFVGMARVHYVGTCIRLKRGLTIKQWILKRYDQ